MAQTMLLMPGVSTHTTNLKKDSLLQIQIQKLKPTSSFSTHLLFSPLSSVSSSSSSSSSSSAFKTLAIFKSKAKAAPAKTVVEKPKSGGEGVFGTSGKIGFTKENELFVGRVAMLGFAVKGKDELKTMKKMGHPMISMVLLITLISVWWTPVSMAIDYPRAASLFRRACIGCHDAGGNIIQPGATLFAQDLQRNGVDSEDDIFGVTYYGKGRMPGFGEKCMPRGQCTFGPRLQDDEIRLLAQFVKEQAEKGWPSIEIYGD